MKSLIPFILALSSIACLKVPPPIAETIEVQSLPRPPPSKVAFPDRSSEILSGGQEIRGEGYSFILPPGFKRTSIESYENAEESIELSFLLYPQSINIFDFALDSIPSSFRITRTTGGSWSREQSFVFIQSRKDDTERDEVFIGTQPTFHLACTLFGIENGRRLSEQDEHRRLMCGAIYDSLLLVWKL